MSEGIAYSNINIWRFFKIAVYSTSGATFLTSSMFAYKAIPLDEGSVSNS